MPKKILLADDSITIQKVVELTFSDGDYEVVAVNNGAKAIQKLEELIEASKASAASAAPAPTPAETIPMSTTESPWEEPAAPAPHEEPFAAPEPFAHGGDIFGAPAAPVTATTEMPFEAPPETS